MNKRQIIAALNKISNELDLNNLYKEANTVTKVMSRLAMESTAAWRDTGEPDGACQKCGEFMFGDDTCPRCGYGEDAFYPNRGLTEGLDEISNMMDMHGDHPADKRRVDYSKDYNNPTKSEMEDVFLDLDELVLENMTMNRLEKERYEEIKMQIMDALK